MEVVVVTNDQQREDALKVRKIVFVEEQNVPPDEEIDEFENVATHFVCYNDNHEPIGAGRFRQLDDIGKIERICVLPSYRKNGVGKLIMNAIINYAKEKGFNKVKLNSQTHAIPFYEKLGFTIASDEYMEAGIPHRTMIKTLT